MKHEFSIAHLTALSLSPPRLVEVAARAGYRYVGLRLNRVTPSEPLYALADDRALMAETKARLADSGVAVLDIELARMGPENDPGSYVPLLEAAAELGAAHILTQLPDPEFNRAAEHRTNAGILVDTLHFARSGSSLEALRKLPREWFRYAQVCDAPAQAPKTRDEVIHAARFERLFPGEGGLGVREVLACLPAGIPYALEIPRVSLSRLIGAEEYIRLALVAAQKYLDAPEEVIESARN